MTKYLSFHCTVHCPKLELGLGLGLRLGLGLTVRVRVIPRAPEKGRAACHRTCAASLSLRSLADSHPDQLPVVRGSNH